jgi:hypothetical protein
VLAGGGDDTGSCEDSESAAMRGAGSQDRVQAVELMGVPERGGGSDLLAMQTGSIPRPRHKGLAPVHVRPGVKEHKAPTAARQSLCCIWSPQALASTRKHPGAPSPRRAWGLAAVSISIALSRP